MKKSYNLRALEGDNYTDKQLQADMAKWYGINIPDNVLYTPELNEVVIKEVEKKNIDNLQKDYNPLTGKNYTEKEAEELAKGYKKRAETQVKHTTENY